MAHPAAPIVKCLRAILIFRNSLCCGALYTAPRNAATMRAGRNFNSAGRLTPIGWPSRIRAPPLERRAHHPLPMIEVRGVSKYYGRFVGVRDLTFAIPQGQVVALLGPNGAGKTT